MLGRSSKVWISAVVLGVALTGAGFSGAVKADLKEGTPDLKSPGPLAFAPDGVLLVGDPLGAAVFAIQTNDDSGSPKPVNIRNIQRKCADLLGASPREIRINDLAVNPASGNVYLSIARGPGADATPVILRAGADGKITEFSLKNVKFDKALLPNAPDPEAVRGRGRRRTQLRLESITDLAFVDGKVYVAGLSNEEFQSTLRAIPYPFRKAARGAGVKIFHGAHGKYETNSPVRTFTNYKIDGKQHLLCAYTCTPLVKIPVSQLEPGAKVNGVTIAELGNGNRPLDMFVYNKGGTDYILLSNSRRGVMKIPTKDFGRAEGITERVSRQQETAGVKYDTVEGLKGILQLDRLDKVNAVALVQGEGGAVNLKTIPLP